LLSQNSIKGAIPTSLSIIPTLEHIGDCSYIRHEFQQSIGNCSSFSLQHINNDIP
jgi:hypothetical protein